ncbi:hypothetical protein ABHN84_17465 [Shewanella vesiculosa]|jgi:hypothetical protein|uniref:Uncharacterized protein n=1 Tax=Shewanella vesiculosa TaxID=518738 RepID=A0ABV0FT86_9GAMM
MALDIKWIKRNIPEGDLQLLTTCNASGVLRLTQSNYGIDQTTYFRNNVFNSLTWIVTDGKEMASATFKLETNGQDRGLFRLNLSHKPSWEAEQSNYTTGLHWGTAIGVIQDDSLIGKTLTLYEAIDEGYDYLITIE